METEKLLKEIRDFTDRAHGDQMRKYTPERYIVHPVRVMEICRQYTDDISMLAAALMHDVLEDTPVTREEIRTFLLERMSPAQTSKTLKLVEELTDEFIHANYPHLNRKARKAQEAERLGRASADAQTIKYADIIDNAREIAVHDASFARLFLRECGLLLQKMQKGHATLYALAQETLQKASGQLRSSH